MKGKAPSSHTFPEIIYHRFKKNAHIIFLLFGLMTNTIVTAMLILGGAAVVSSLTGINIYVAAFLMPIGVIIYTFFGGLKATFFAEYLDSTFIFFVILIFVVVIYFTNHQVGGIGGLYNKLTKGAFIKPVEGNSGGTFLTIASSGALIFGIINIVGNFGTVFVDQAYWQKAIASRRRSAVKGFLIGGLAWFAIPFTLATTLGLSAVANNPRTDKQRPCCSFCRFSFTGRCRSYLVALHLVYSSYFSWVCRTGSCILACNVRYLQNLFKAFGQGT